MRKLLFLLLPLLGCEDQWEGCYTCKTQYYENAELVYQKDNVYCGMSDSEAEYFEKINSVKYDKDSIEVEVVINCRR